MDDYITWNAFGVVVGIIVVLLSLVVAIITGVLAVGGYFIKKGLANIQENRDNINTMKGRFEGAITDIETLKAEHREMQKQMTDNLIKIATSKDGKSL